jgi:predicted acylesterase/phospholipase RssA
MANRRTNRRSCWRRRTLPARQALIEPPLGDYPILAFDRYEPIIDIGYQSAREAIAAWRAAAAASA